MSWIRRIAPTVAAAAAIALTVSLGNWQMRRAEEKRALQAQRDEADAASPVEIGREAVDPAAVELRRAAATGTFLPERTVYVDNRTWKGVAGFHVLTPLKMEGSSLHLLVLRGWVPRDARDRAALPPVPAPSGPVRVEGIAERDLAQAMELARSAPPGPQDRLWQNASLERFAAWSGLPMQPIVLRQLGDASPAPGVAGAAAETLRDGLVRDWPRPGGDVDKHRGYAFQWYSLAALVAALWLWFVVLRPRRAGAASGRSNEDADR